SSSRLSVTTSKVKNELLHAHDHDVEKACKGATVVYVTGPLFFANASKLPGPVYAALAESDKLIFSMRGVSGMDTTGAEILLDVVRECRDQNVEVVLCGLNEPIRKRLDQAGIMELLSEDAFFFSVDRALVSAVPAP
ncbi:MAG: sodium-independent anion transporter, partial [Bacillota bacterium]